MNKNTLFITSLIILMFIPTIGYSQTDPEIRGEVINVNHHLKVAFIDIGQQDLEKGDVVAIQITHDEVVYMQVLEATGVISKIGIGANAKKYFNVRPSDFKGIRIGNIVEKMKFYNPDKEGLRASADNRDGGVPVKELKELVGSAKDIASQTDLNAEAMERSHTLPETENCSNDRIVCMERVNLLEGKIRALTQKLKYMQELIEENSFPME